jgi:hypothetical protein
MSKADRKSYWFFGGLGMKISKIEKVPTYLKFIINSSLERK